MDFDDLDEAINQRIAEEGKLDGVAALLAVGSRDLKVYKPTCFMDPMPRKAPQLLGLSDVSAKAVAEEVKRKICIRAFLFYGEGECASQFACMLGAAPESIDIAVYEWPGHGLRAKEAPCLSMEAMAEDALAAIQPAIDEMGIGGRIEGAPFAFIGSSAGAVLMTAVAEKLRWSASVEPSAVIVLDRAPPHMPLLSEIGLKELTSKPDDFYKAYMPRETPALAPTMVQGLLHDWKLACETRELGSHIFGCDVTVLRAKGSAKWDDVPALGKFKATTLALEGSDEYLTVPISSASTAGEVKKALAKVSGISADSLSLQSLKGSEKVTLVDSARVDGRVTVKGLASFRPQPEQWPHPIGIIGAGYNGIKCAMEYARDGRDNFTLFDRNDKVGGYCWITAANKDSKLQTEFAAFHVWFGPEYIADKHCGGEGAWPTGWNCWAKKDEVLRHFHYAAEEWGILKHVQFQTNVSKLDIIGQPDAHDRYYKLTVDSAKNDGTPSKEFACSLVYSFPGSMTKCRDVTFPGEETFGGQIGYGMCDDFDYRESTMSGKDGVILGNGAFAVENVRTCVEHGARKVYLITRRKNLASPRFACWFVHQGPAPTPGGMVVQTMEPMYKLCGMGDPWQYWSVHANQDRSKVTIWQASRFGIGDVTFLCAAYGKLEYIEGQVDCFGPRKLMLKSGRMLEDIHFVVKSLGLLGDFGVDKLHNMDYMLGCFCGGDWRRTLLTDPVGMNAANFTTFSLGNGIHSTVKMVKFLYDYPQEYFRAEKARLLQNLPISKAKLDLERPSYVVDVKFVMSTSIIINAFVPLIQRLTMYDDLYMHALFHKVHPFEKYHTEAVEDWNKYQEMFQRQGCDHEYIEYPYTRQVIQGYVDQFNRTLGTDATLDGPSEESVKKIVQGALDAEKFVKDKVFCRGLCSAISALPEAPEADPTEMLDRSLAHDARARLTHASEKSAMDFDTKQIEEWRQWASVGKCTIVDIDADHASLKDHMEAIKKVFALIVDKQSPPPN